ncbi:MAG TPA: PIN domain-containing protein [Gemmatimonadales bacterium]|nr:PIN domain-containing protein [Gemmatimonadales bacterium]
MGAELFVDTSAWYPAVVRSHPDHGPVAAALRQAVRQGRRLVTTNLVVAETHVLLLRRAGRDAALTFVQAAASPPNLVVASSAEHERVAVEKWLTGFDDQDFSFADAVSFAVMTARGIEDALTLDHHFAVAGFRIIGGRP